MVLVAGPDLPPLYYKESTEARRCCRFCLKPVTTVAPRQTEKPPDRVNVQVARGKTTTFIHLDEDEAHKVQTHGEHVLKKIQKIHKSLIWNILVGRSFVDKIPRGKQGSEEINIDHDENSEFDSDNPKTWSEESLDFIGSLLKASEFSYDGFVILFCVENDPRDTAIDYDELAWELEKCLVYHLVSHKSQICLNEEATMSRRGLDPVSRKTKTPGRKRSGFLVYLAYQLLDSVGHDQMVGEAINRAIDLNMKKKQLLQALTECKLMPQVDERLRKQVKEIKEFMSKDQLEMVSRLREVKDPDSVRMLEQFLNLLRSNSAKDHRASGFMGLNQFLNFLNQGVDEPCGNNNGRASSRLSQVTSPRVGHKTSAPSATGLPRPTSSIRKHSLASSQMSTLSSRSTTPDTPRQQHHRRESSLASIPDSESSTPETLRKQEHKASQSKKSSGSRLSSSATRNGRAAPASSSAKASPRAPVTTRAQKMSSSTGPSRSANNGESPATSRRLSSASRLSNATSGAGSTNATPTSSATNSPRIGGAARCSKDSRLWSRSKREPPKGKMITREDLRRMNQSYPSPGRDQPTKKAATKKPSSVSSSFSRASIPMS